MSSFLLCLSCIANDKERRVSLAAIACTKERTGPSNQVRHEVKLGTELGDFYKMDNPVEEPMSLKKAASLKEEMNKNKC